MIGVTGLEPIPDGAFAGHLQAEPDAAQLAARLRELLVDVRSGAAAARGTAARERMRALYAPEALGAFLEVQFARIARSLEASAAAAGAASSRGEL
jgi:hypothetical protein